MKKSNLIRKRSVITSKIITPAIELSEEQIEFILQPINESCHLKACPGSGKTEVVGIKAAYEISQWTLKFSGIAFLSFTKNAAKEISDRVTKYGGVQAAQHPHFVGTIDAWLHNYILHPFGHKKVGFAGRNNDRSFKLVDNEENYSFLSSFKTILSNSDPYMDAWVNDYYLECLPPYLPISQSRYLKLDGIDTEKQTELRNNKKKFFKAGLATYTDAESICYFLLQANPILLGLLAKRFSVIYIDECQDLSNSQLEILQLLINSGAKIHFVGDSNQSIYEFKKVSIEAIESFISKNGMKELYLTKNFRSNQKIVNVAMKLESLTTSATIKEIKGHEAYLLEDCCILLEYDKKHPENIPKYFIEIINEINASLQDKKKHIDIAQSAILARSHNTLSLFKSSPNNRLSKVELFANAINCWNTMHKTGLDMQNALHQLGKAISLLAYNGDGNHKNQYCPEGYTNLQWRAFLFILITEACLPINNLYPFQDKSWSQWAKMLKTFLASKWHILQSPNNNWESVKTKITAPQKGASKQVSDYIKTINSMHTEKIRMTTFHDVKGETMHAAMIVSAKDKTSQGGHYEHWLSSETDKKEFVRFAYVASSRPKHLLVWAIPKKSKNEHIKTIEQMGFKLKKVK